MSTDTQLSFGPTCPAGSSWYACGDIFLGCCGSYACSTKGCAQGDLQPVAYDTTQHGKFPDASCGAGSNFYTCNAGPTFWGCCKSNPCGTGICPENDLTGALVGSPVQSAYYLAGDTSATASPATSLVPGPSTAGNFTVATPTSTTTSETATGPSTNTRFIAGVAAAAGVVLALFVGWLVYYICFVRRSAKKNQDEFESRQSVLSVARDTEKNKDSRISYASAPPEYSSPNPNTYSHHVTPGAGGFWKPQHRARPSELSGETVWCELETPMPSPLVNSTPQSPRIVEPSPRTGSHQFTETGLSPTLGTWSHPIGEDETSEDEHRPGPSN